MAKQPDFIWYYFLLLRVEKALFYTSTVSWRIWSDFCNLELLGSTLTNRAIPAKYDDIKLTI